MVVTGNEKGLRKGGRGDATIHLNQAVGRVAVGA